MSDATDDEADRLAGAALEIIADRDRLIATLRATVERVQAENVRLREALKPFVAHWEEWMMNYPAEQRVSTAARVTFGELRTARAALDPQ